MLLRPLIAGSTNVTSRFTRAIDITRTNVMTNTIANNTANNSGTSAIDVITNMNAVNTSGIDIITASNIMITSGITTCSDIIVTLQIQYKSARPSHFDVEQYCNRQWLYCND